VSIDTIEKYLHNLYAVQPDFLYSVSRDFIGNCRTPMLVLPDDVPGHPLQTSIDVASLARRNEAASAWIVKKQSATAAAA
jgi:hypothetical protein